MNKHRNILNFISIIRDSHSLMVDIYTKGSCFNFFLILKKVYPEAVAYYNVNHVITCIDNRFYDITGEVKNSIGYNKFITPHFYKKSKIIKELLNGEYSIST